MAWNTEPKVAAARDFDRKFKAPVVVILYVDEQGRFGYASYGRTKQLCRHAQELADKTFDMIEAER